MPRVAIIIYTLYGHIAALAEAEKVGLEENKGVEVDILQVPETLPPDDVKETGGEPRPEFPVASRDTLKEYDAFMFGVPAKLGNLPAQWKAFWDATGSLWLQGSLHGKLAGVFTSSSTYGENETAIVSMVTTLAHHGIVYVPLGYAGARRKLSHVGKVHGGGPWGAGTLTGPDGSRDVIGLEEKVAKEQGRRFGKILANSTT
ncbi:BN860_06150g1_1 [Zygosaccharomyces bailii CLIB 213]|uniref:BN860_06150g1_1 n=1 Tax=Zygosaccharomyces bailii (strain CLIB 213 / ATCC 58445 / CBS 680 / BCRC 21525 / NBRC 1098 / NCYC 1416 / NRRL Y-2227) TaxID=1333698 RepID=A0A8J2T572_ZYGB2|nr:BN860_06150g1_1 [Zygosaccharomyces bailii CLIB 213]